MMYHLSDGQNIFYYGIYKMQKPFRFKLFDKEGVYIFLLSLSILYISVIVATVVIFFDTK